MDEAFRWVIKISVAGGAPAIAAIVGVGLARNNVLGGAILNGVGRVATPAGQALNKFGQGKRDSSAAAVGWAGAKHQRDQKRLNKALAAQGRPGIASRGWGAYKQGGVKGVGKAAAGAPVGWAKTAGVKGRDIARGRSKQASRDFLAGHHVEGVTKELEGLNMETAQAVDKYKGNVEQATAHLANLHPERNYADLKGEVVATANDMRARGIALGTDSTKRALMNYGASTGTMLSGTGQAGQEGYFDHVQSTYSNQARGFGYTLSARIAAGGQGYTQGRPGQLVVEKEGKSNLGTMHTAVADHVAQLQRTGKDAEASEYVANIGQQIGVLEKKWQADPGARDKLKALQDARKRLEAQHGQTFTSGYQAGRDKVSDDKIVLTR